MRNERILSREFSLRVELVCRRVKEDESIFSSPRLLVTRVCEIEMVSEEIKS